MSNFIIASLSSAKNELMKKTILLLVWLFILSPVFSQETAVDKLHAGIQSTKNIKKQKAVTIPAIPELLQQLKNTRSPARQVDILFDIVGTYLNRLKIDSALFYTQKIKIISDSARYEQGLAKYFLARGSALFYRNKGGEVVNNLHQAISLFTKYRNNLFLGITYHQLARQLGNTSNYIGAQKLYRQAISIITSAGDLNRLQWAVHNCGRNFFFTLETDSAAYYLTWAVKLAEQLENDAKIFNSASMLGQVYLIAGDAKNAGQTLSYALSVKPASADKIQLRSVLANYAEALTIQNKFESAAKAIKNYEKLNNSLGDVSGSMIEKKLKGNLHYHQGEYKEALQYLLEAYNLKKDGALFSHDIMSIAASLGKTELKTGNIDDAIGHFRVVKDLAVETNYIAGTLESSILMAEAFQQNGNIDSAYHYLKFHSHLRDSILTFKKEKTVRELIARYDAEKKEQQIKNLEAGRQIFEYQLQLTNETIDNQKLLDVKKSQQLILLTQQAEINRLQASEKNLALLNREKEFLKKQNELELVKKETQLQVALAARQAQQKKVLMLAIAAILLCGVYGLYRYRQNKKLSSRLAQSITELKQAQQQLIKTEKEKEAENIRLGISRDIHDEVGATLSGVALYSEIAKQKMEEHKNNEAKEYLQYISDNSKEMVEKLSDIIWTINPKNDSFERIIARLRSYSMNLCGSKDIHLHFDVQSELQTYTHSMPMYRNIYLLVKEAINNAVKYSGAKNIFFSMKKIDQGIVTEVRDDGVGFDKKAPVTGNGMANMRERAKNMNADLNIDSSPDKGTLIRLQLAFHPNEVIA